MTPRGVDRMATHSAQHARDVAGADVVAQTGGADAAEPLDDGLAPLVFQFELERFDPVALDAAVGDVPLLLEDVGDPLLETRVRQGQGREQGLVGVANPREQIGDRVGHRLTNWLW